MNKYIYAHTAEALLIFMQVIYNIVIYPQISSILWSWQVIYIIVCWSSLWWQIIEDDFETGTSLDMSFEPCIYDTRRPYT